MPLQHKIDCLLFAYRNAPHTVTGQPPAVLMFNRRLRSKIDLLKPNLRRDVEDRQYQQVCKRPARVSTQLQVGQPVLARNYRSADKWVPATVYQREGPLTYQVKVGESVIRRHADQLVSTPSTRPDPQTTEAYAQTEEQDNELEDPSEGMDTASSSAEPDQSHANIADVAEPSLKRGPSRTERRYPTRVRRPPERLNL